MSGASERVNGGANGPDFIVILPIVRRCLQACKLASCKHASCACRQGPIFVGRKGGENRRKEKEKWNEKKIQKERKNAKMKRREKKKGKLV